MRGKWPLVALGALAGGAVWVGSMVESSAQGLTQHRGEQHQLGVKQEPQVPMSLRAEHEELHKALFAATQMGGKTGPAADKVAALLHPHFQREEQFALPPLGMLKKVALSKSPKKDKAVLAMTNRLRQEYGRMIAEHHTIVGALDKLAMAARSEDHPEVVEFAAKLKMHAQNEEEVLYPAAIVLGEYLKLKGKT